MVLPRSAIATFPPASLLGHDAGADDGRDEEPRAERFGGETPRQGATRRHAVDDPPAVLVDDALAILLENSPCCGGRRSRTASEGRQSRTPLGVTTIGRLIRIGCAIMASRSWSSVEARIVEAELGVGRALLAEDVAHRNAHAVDELPQQEPGRRRLQVFDDVRLDAGVADQASVLRDVPQSGLW